MVPASLDFKGFRVGPYSGTLGLGDPFKGLQGT